MLKIVARYIFYKLFASHRKGFGVHSPFVFHLVSRVLPIHDDENLKLIKTFRRSFFHDKRTIQTSNSGAGSKVHRWQGRSIRQIVTRSSIRHKYGRVLYTLVQEFKPAEIIELGTGIGISTAYLAKACPKSKIISIENDKGKMTFASALLKRLDIRNVTLVNGTFNENLPVFLNETRQPLFVFIDGDHTYEGTMNYFREVKKFSNPDTIIVFDDIRWSQGMEKAWAEIKSDMDVKISIDLFFMGIVFFREGIPKQDFVINF
jgi:predicted O-methyltransferase YrrM